MTVTRISKDFYKSDLWASIRSEENRRVGIYDEDYSSEIPVSMTKTNEKLYKKHMDRVEKTFDYIACSEEDKAKWNKQVYNLYFGIGIDDKDGL